MAADEIIVDLQGMEDFTGRLAPYLQHIAGLLSTLSHSDEPELGDFFHAQLVEQHYDDLRRDFLVRMRRLVLAVAVSEASVDSIIETISSTSSSGAAQLRGAVDLMTDSATARAALQSDTAVAKVLQQDPLLNQAIFAPAPTVSDGHNNHG
jgi:hypothetical protein